MLPYEALEQGLESTQHSLVQLTCTENAIACSVGIVRMVRLTSKKNVYKMNQRTEKV